MKPKDYAARRRARRTPPTHQRLAALAMRLAEARDLRGALQAGLLAERLARLEKAARGRQAGSDLSATLSALRAPPPTDAPAPQASAPPIRATGPSLEATMGLSDDELDEVLFPPDLLAQIRAARAAREPS